MMATYTDHIGPNGHVVRHFDAPPTREQEDYCFKNRISYVFPSGPLTGPRGYADQTEGGVDMYPLFLLLAVLLALGLAYVTVRAVVTIW